MSEALWGVVIGGLIALSSAIVSPLIAERYVRSRWRLQRREDAYVANTRYLVAAQLWAAKYFRGAGRENEKDFEPPTESEMRDVAALVSLHASRDVRKFMDDLDMHMVALHSAGVAVRKAAEVDGGMDGAAYADLETARATVLAQIKSTREQMARELA